MANDEIAKRTPLHTPTVIALSISLLANGFSLTVLLPFVYFMVRDFGIGETENDVARFAGWIAGAYTFGQFLSGYTWGRVSDKIGRKFIIMQGVILNGTFLVLFGISSSFYMAVLMRFLGGCFNGVTSTTKTYISEITDTTNKGKGFSLLGFNWSIGMILGTLAGGWLSSPCDQHPQYFNEDSTPLFCDEPYLLPCLAGGAVCFVAFLMDAFILSEPQKWRDNKVARDLAKKAHAAEQKAVVNVGETDKSEPSDATPLLTKPVEDHRFMSLMKRSQVFFAVLSYALLGMAGFAFNDILAVWAATPTDKGGLGWKSSQTGALYAAAGLSSIIFQLFIFPRLQRAWGNRRCYMTGCTGFAFVIAIWAYSRYLRYDTTLLWGALILLVIFRQVFSNLSFTSSFIIISDAAPPGAVGAVNGIGQTTASLWFAGWCTLCGFPYAWAKFDLFWTSPRSVHVLLSSRAVGPLICGYLFTFSLHQNKWPLDSSLVFSFIACLLLTSAALGSRIKHKE